MKNYFESELAKTIWERKYRVQNESLDDWFKRVSGNNPDIEKLIREKKFIFGGRILANRGTNLGSNSNCYTIGRVPDSLSGIFAVAHDEALTFKAQGGEGHSLTLIRPKGSKINNSYQSDGIVPFMELFDTVCAITKQGNSRRGALLMSINASHKDIKDFITIKADEHKINNANLSVEINDDFMEAVERYYHTGEEIILHKSEKYGHNIVEWDYCPIKIFKMIAEYACKYAEPGVIFMNRFSHYNLMAFDPEYRIYSCNPCKLNSLCTA